MVLGEPANVLHVSGMILMQKKKEKKNCKLEETGSGKRENKRTHRKEIIPKFVVLGCGFANFEWVFLFRQSFEWGWS